MEPRIIVHGGMELGYERDESVLSGIIRETCAAGYRVLQSGRSNDPSTPTPAVLHAVKILEGHPLFNAGVGSLPQRDGQVRMDACIADGYHRTSGAVAQIQNVRNPILIADLVMNRTKHSLLAGPEAQQFAYSQDFPPFYDNLTREGFGRWEAGKSDLVGRDHGTVGAVAVDSEGRIVAATSTGGWMTSLPGRVGDVPIFGAGTYADENVGVSCTGHGEKIAHVGVGRLVGFYVGEMSMSLGDAVDKALEKLKEIEGVGALIAVSKDGETIFRSTEPDAYVPWATK